MRNFLPAAPLLERRVAVGKGGGAEHYDSRFSSRSKDVKVRRAGELGRRRISVQASRQIRASICCSKCVVKCVLGKTLANVGDESGARNLQNFQFVNRHRHVDIACAPGSESCGPHKASGGPRNWCYSPPRFATEPACGRGQSTTRRRVSRKAAHATLSSSGVPDGGFQASRFSAIRATNRGRSRRRRGRNRSLRGGRVHKMV